MPYSPKTILAVALSLASLAMLLFVVGPARNATELPDAGARPSTRAPEQRPLDGGDPLVDSGAPTATEAITVGSRTEPSSAPEGRQGAGAAVVLTVTASIFGAPGIKVSGETFSIQGAAVSDETGESHTFSLSPNVTSEVRLPATGTYRFTLGGPTWPTVSEEHFVTDGGDLEITVRPQAGLMGRIEAENGDVPGSLAYRYRHSRVRADGRKRTHESTQRDLCLGPGGEFLILGEHGAGTYEIVLDESVVKSDRGALSAYVPGGAIVDLGTIHLRERPPTELDVQVVASPGVRLQGGTLTVAALSTYAEAVGIIDGKVALDRSAGVRELDRQSAALDDGGRQTCTAAGADAYLITVEPGFGPLSHRVVRATGNGREQVTVHVPSPHSLDVEILVDEWFVRYASDVRLELRDAGVVRRTSLAADSVAGHHEFVVSEAAVGDIALVADWAQGGSVLQGQRLAVSSIPPFPVAGGTVVLDARLGPHEDAVTIEVLLPDGVPGTAVATFSRPGAARQNRRRIPIIEGALSIPRDGSRDYVRVDWSNPDTSRVALACLPVSAITAGDIQTLDLRRSALVGSIAGFRGDDEIRISPNSVAPWCPEDEQIVLVYPDAQGAFEVFGLAPGAYRATSERTEATHGFEVPRVGSARLELKH